MIEEILKNARQGAGGRRILTSDQKALIVSEWDKSDLGAPEFCRRHGLIASMLYRWRKDGMRGAAMGIRNGGELYTRTEVEFLRKENEELKKALGEASLDIKILKKKLEMDERRRNSQRLNNSPVNLT